MTVVCAGGGGSAGGSAAAEPPPPPPHDASHGNIARATNTHAKALREGAPEMLRVSTQVRSNRFRKFYRDTSRRATSAI